MAQDFTFIGATVDAPFGSFEGGGFIRVKIAGAFSNVPDHPDDGEYWWDLSFDKLTIKLGPQFDSVNGQTVLFELNPLLMYEMTYSFQLPLGLQDGLYEMDISFDLPDSEGVNADFWDNYGFVTFEVGSSNGSSSYISGRVGQDDRLIGDSDSNGIFGDSGNDFLSGKGGNDTLYGGSGNDTLNGGSGKDSLIASSGNDSLNGDDGNDKLFGDDGNDKLFGNDGNDKLFGGDGKDKLSGGNGNDTLNGGNGNDTFEFSKSSGKDKITDFRGGDVIEIESGANRMKDLDFTDTKAGLLVEFGNVDIFLKGLDRGDVNSSDFDFV
jgi:hypothetical protein